MASKLDKASVADMLKGDDGFAFSILAAALDAVDGDIASMDHTELIEAVNDAYGCTMSETSESKLGAAVTALTTDYWATSQELFKSMALAFSSGDTGDGDDGLSACEAVWAVMECAVIRGETFEEVAESLSKPVADFVNGIVDSESEDQEDVDGEDGLEDKLVTPYYGRYANAMLMSLAGQVMGLAVKGGEAFNAVREACNEFLLENGLAVPET